MKLENILAEWDVDSQLDRTKLDTVSLDLPKMHAKYLRILANERLLLKKYDAEYKQLKFDKYDFYCDGWSEDHPIEWKEQQPARGRILKADVGRYLEADKDIINLSLKMGMQNEKIEVLKSIVDTISRLGFQVKNAIDWMRFQNGS